MKFYKFYFILFFVSINLQGQIGISYKSIDSIQEHIKKSTSLDSISIAKEHYKIGELYRKLLLSDSAYYYYHNAENVFKKTNNKYELAITLYGIAVVQCNEKDYTGSEVTSFEAITLLEELDQVNHVRKYKSYLYNNLGIVYDELETYDKSIKYYKQALKLKRKLNGDYTRSIGITLNNLIKVYRRSGRFDLATNIYNEIYENKGLIKNYPDIYALALGNYANTLFLSKKNDKLPFLYFEALRICDSINDTYNTIIIHQHLAEYYKSNNKIDSAKFYAHKAKDLSEQYNKDDLLKSLLLLSKVENSTAAVKYLKDYVKLSDSLQKVERATRNKFARIRFETNQIEQENKQIARERMWLLIISIILIVASLLLYIVITQRNKNNELKFRQEQQEANEEIYNLMLSQNESIEEARTIEKQRISEELHDGVLGRLFGTRLSLDSLNMNNSVEAIKTRAQYIDELKTIEQDIRKVSHELNTDFVSGSGFKDIIKTLIETQANIYKLKYNLVQDDTIIWEEVSNKTKIHIYRIIQEALHNIYKHANAKTVNISFKLKNKIISLKMSDDGTGFNVNKAKTGIGLKNMNSRIKEINGTISITSKQNVGTTVTIEVPIA